METKTETTTQYWVKVAYWNGDHYETFDQYGIEPDNLEDSISYVDAMTPSDWDQSVDCDKNDHDVRVTLYEVEADSDDPEDDDLWEWTEVYEQTFEISVAETKQADMDEKWSCKVEFCTKHLGRKDNLGVREWYTWATNGGVNGAYDRRHRSGRWIETYEEPKEITVHEANEWLVQHGWDKDEARAEVYGSDDEDNTNV